MGGVVTYGVVTGLEKSWYIFDLRFEHIKKSIIDMSMLKLGFENGFQFLMEGQFLNVNVCPNGSPQAISTITLNSDSAENGYGSEYGIPSLRTNYTTFSRELGNKQYELVNHLGNVMVTVSDKKLGITSTGIGYIA
jgi:hypothetical protein